MAVIFVSLMSLVLKINVAPPRLVTPCLCAACTPVPVCSSPVICPALNTAEP